MRIYIDPRINTFYIEGVSSGPVTDYVVSHQGNNVSVFRNSTQLYDLYLVPFQNLSDQNGNSFPDVNTCVNYLTALTTYQAPITATYPLAIDTQNNMTVDSNYITDGLNF